MKITRILANNTTTENVTIIIIIRLVDAGLIIISNKRHVGLSKTPKAVLDCPARNNFEIAA